MTQKTKTLCYTVLVTVLDKCPNLIGPLQALVTKIYWVGSSGMGTLTWSRSVSVFEDFKTFSFFILDIESFFPSFFSS